MNFTGEIRVKAARDAVFARLEDLRFFTSCIDGVHDLELVDADHFKAVLETRIAYIRFKFAIEGEIVERNAPVRMVARSEGTPMGVVGRLTATSAADLTEADGTTTIAYSIELALTGKLGSLGQPVLRSKAKELEKQFATNLAAAFEPGGLAGPMSPFAFDEPSTLDEALGLLDADDPTVRPFAGGTALMLMMKSAAFAPSRLVSLGRIHGNADGSDSSFVGVRRVRDGALEIGAMTPLSTIEHSPLVHAHAPVVPRAMKRLANVRVRNVACIGGTLSHGDPHMDLPPIFASLGAEVDIVRAGGETRTIAVQDLYRGYYETEIANDELIRVVRIPSQVGRAGNYVKCTTRTADDWPALGVAINARRDDGRWSDVRIVLGAVTERPTRLVEAERELEGHDSDETRFARAGEAAAAAVDPETDVRGTSAYKRQLVRVYVGRALRAAGAMEGAR